MLDELHTATRNAGSWGASPLSVSEIDAHPDADRIWATIANLQGEYQRGYDDGADSVDEDAVAEDERDECRREIESFIRTFDRELEQVNASKLLGWIEGKMASLEDLL